MSRAFTQNHYHLVFSTKNRHPYIDPELQARLFPFIGGTLRDLRCTMLAIGGMPDHVHVLVRYPSELSHADLARHIKSRSSKWIHEMYPELRDFAWQEGYGGFTVSMSMVPTVEAYITDQREHHRAQDFKTEFLALLRLNQVEFAEAEVFL